MKYLVTWTSGLDSTAMIYRLLQEGHEVIACYFHMKSNVNKTKRELNALSKLKDLLACDRFTFLGTVATIDIENTGAVARFPIFSITIPYILGLAERHKVDVVAYGFTAHDIIISYWDEVRAVFNSYLPFMKHKPMFEAPMMKVPKDEAWFGLPEEIREHIVYCEDQFIKEGDCGKCAQCRRMVFHRIKKYD